MDDRPFPTHYSAREGTAWIPWDSEVDYDDSYLTLRHEYYIFIPRRGRDSIKVHAIKFSNGSIWDCVNGWRIKPVLVAMRPTMLYDSNDKQEAIAEFKRLHDIALVALDSCQYIPGMRAYQATKDGLTGVVELFAEINKG